MDRWGCVDVPALPLQLLLRRQPRWARQPVGVVDQDHPQGRILWLNERAWRSRVRAGLRYAEALSLAPTMRAAVVPAVAINAAVERLASRLRRFTPEVEPCAEEPGVFWLNASGLQSAYPSLAVWARGIVADLRSVGFTTTVVVGFDRFSSYALARAGKGVRVLQTAAAERQLADRVPLDLLHLEPKVRAALAQLGVDDVGALRRLPAAGVLERFGVAGARLQRLAAGTCRMPLAPLVEVPLVCARYEIDPEEPGLDLTSLLFLLKARLAALCAELARRGEAVAALRLRVLLDGAPGCEERLQAAVPTLDEVQLLDLVRLRLESRAFTARPIGFDVHAEGARATREQLQLFVETPRRDLRAANRALASLRAELGEQVVVRAVLRDGHLPEACFTWETLTSLSDARPDVAVTPRLVRRLLTRPQALAHQQREADGWLAGGLPAGSVEQLDGPYRITGGWWRHEVQRDYWFAQTRRGDVLWIYYDRRRRRWFRQGGVE